MYLNFELVDIFLYFNYGIISPFLIQYLNLFLTKIEYVMFYQVTLWYVQYRNVSAEKSCYIEEVTNHMNFYLSHTEEGTLKKR